MVLAPEGRGRDLVEAERLLRRALDRAPHHERARLLLARLAEARGDLEAATAVYRAILEANPDCRPARSRLVALAGDSG
jgi:cytochrome c-type biogenesis protein CcmH/NrfG